MFFEVLLPFGAIMAEFLEEVEVERVVSSSRETVLTFMVINIQVQFGRMDHQSLVRISTLSVINQYMILRIVVNDNNLGPTKLEAYIAGTGWSMDMDLPRRSASPLQLSPSDAQKVEGYLAHKWGLRPTYLVVIPILQIIRYPRQHGARFNPYRH